MDVVTAPPTPYLLAMLVCDQVITDAETSKKTLVGIFDRIYTSGFPAMHPLVIYARMTDAQGSYKFLLQMVDLQNDQILGTGDTDAIRIPDRLQPFELAVRLPVQIPHEGAYEVRLIANNAYVGRVTFTAMPMPQPARGG